MFENSYIFLNIYRLKNIQILKTTKLAICPELYVNEMRDGLPGRKAVSVIPQKILQL